MNGAGSFTNNGVINVSGVGSLGIRGSTTGTGALTLTSNSVQTSNTGDTGIVIRDLDGGTGRLTLNSTTISTTGATSDGIVAQSASGAQSLTATTVTASGAGEYFLNDGLSHGTDPWLHRSRYA